MKPLAYSYQRFSSPDQSKGDSLRRQDAALAAFLEREGLVLDTSLKFVDAGVSGYKGKHRADDTKALGNFLSLVKSGRIPAGSYLVVENLDRLSREAVTKALSLLLNLIEAGVCVVQLSPTEVIYRSGADPMQLVIAIIELSRGNSESRMKSVRGEASWAAKRAAARATKKAVSASCPPWLKRVGDRYELIPDRVDTIRRIFELSADGWGTRYLIRQLEEDGRTPFGRGKGWRVSTVVRFLRSRWAVGEYQPTSGGKPAGEPIAGYYPPAVSEALFCRAQVGMDERRQRGGRRAKTGVNLFAGVMVSATTGDPFVYRFDEKKGRRFGRYVNASALSGRASRTAFPVDAFDTAVLSCLKEIDPASLAPPSDSPADDLAALSAQVVDVETRLRKIDDRLLEADDDGVMDQLLEAGKRLRTKRDELNANLAAARTRAAGSEAESWGRCRGLIDAMASASDQESARLRLRSAIRRVVSKVAVLFVRDGSRQMAVAQFAFHGSDETRTVFVYYRGPLGSRGVPAFLHFTTTLEGFDGFDISTFPRATETLLSAVVAESHWHAHVEPDRPTAAAAIAAYRKAYMKEYRRRKAPPRTG